MQQGSTYELLLTVKDSTGNAKNLMSHSARMQIRSSYAATTATESLSTSTGEITMDTANGTMHLILTAERTAAIKIDYNTKTPKGTFIYDLELVDPSNKVSRLMYGDVTVNPEVTR